MMSSGVATRVIHVSCIAIGVALGVLLHRLISAEEGALKYENEAEHVFSKVCGAAGLTSVVEQSILRLPVLCLIKTTGANHRTKADHVMVTWARRCTKLLFVSDTVDEKLPMIFVNVTSGRDFLTDKTRVGVDHVYRHHSNDAEWFLVTDDDSYVIMENLRHLLASHNHSEPVYFGHMHKLYGTKETFFHGGNGYVLSREALRRFGTRAKDLYSERLHHQGDDVEMGRVMRHLGVTFGESRDNEGLPRFYCEAPEVYLLGPIPPPLFAYDFIRPRTGILNVSKHAVAFHHVTAQHMYNMEYLLYRLAPYGRQYAERTS